jgi:hypothetical protein
MGIFILFVVVTLTVFVTGFSFLIFSILASFRLFSPRVLRLAGFPLLALHVFGLLLLLFFSSEITPIYLVPLLGLGSFSLLFYYWAYRDQSLIPIALLSPHALPESGLSNRLISRYVSLATLFLWSYYGIVMLNGLYRTFHEG